MVPYIAASSSRTLENLFIGGERLVTRAMASRDKKADAQECKGKGNACLKAGDFDKAVEWYTEAIKLDGTDHVFYSNRSAAYLSKGYNDSAVKDADECIRMAPTWAKGYARKGAALHAKKKYDKAITAYEEGLKINPTLSALVNGLEQVKKDKSGGNRGGWGGARPAGGMPAGMQPNNPLAGLFGPDLMDKVSAHPVLCKYLVRRCFCGVCQCGRRSADALAARLLSALLRCCLSCCTCTRVYMGAIVCISNIIYYH